MNLSEQKMGTVAALQGVSNLINVVKRSTLKSGDVKDSILAQLKDIESRLTEDNESISNEIEKHRLETAKNCVHSKVDHVIVDNDQYYECITCGAVFHSLPSEDTVVRKTIERY